MSSDNLISADNQQERLKMIGWIVGYTDGEGCFSVSFNKNNTTKMGYQIFPEFVVTQGEKSLNTLRLIKSFFKCGNIFVNKRYDNHKENLYRYCVRNRKDLREKIIPFFKENKLKSAKRKDFEKFVKVIELMEKQKHFTMKGMIQIAKIVQEMNRKIPSTFLKSSETIRQNLVQKAK